MAKWLVMALFVSANSMAQPTISVRIGAAAPFEGSDGTHVELFDMNYWPVGITGSVTMQEHLASWMFASLGIEHDVFPYHRYERYMPAFAVRLLANSGQPAQFTRFRMDVQVHTTPDSIRRPQLFVLVGGGYVLEKYGTIRETWLDSDRGVSDVAYASSPQYYWGIWIGMGSHFRISRYLGIDLSSEYRFGINDWSIIETHSYGSIDLQFVYNFSL